MSCVTVAAQQDVTIMHAAGGGQAGMAAKRAVPPHGAEVSGWQLWKVRVRAPAELRVCLPASMPGDS